MNNPAILVTGANGQLGKELQALAGNFSRYHFYFFGKEELPVDDPEAVDHFFGEHLPAFCINCAAYTAVDKAESEREKTFAVNRDGISMIAAACNSYGAKLLHLSTDYVFDGRSSIPYTETDSTGPENVYGLSKLEGEIAALKSDPEAIIIRTSWLYSSYGNNFVKTMFRLMNERSEINVVNDQSGSPTYAADLARVCMDIITGDHWKSGIYHYANEGRASWYDLAETIRQLTGKSCVIRPIPSSEYPTPAKRPSYSLLNTQKIKNTFALHIPNWQDSLRRCLGQMNVLVK